MCVYCIYILFFPLRPLGTWENILLNRTCTTFYLSFRRVAATFGFVEQSLAFPLSGFPLGFLLIQGSLQYEIVNKISRLKNARATTKNTWNFCITMTNFKCASCDELIHNKMQICVINFLFLKSIRNVLLVSPMTILDKYIKRI